MVREERVLVPVEDWEVLRHVIDYVGSMVAECNHIAVHLFHRLPSLPPQLREHGGSEDSERERELNEELERDIESWISEQTQRCRRTLEEAREWLIGTGVSADAVHLKIDESTFADEDLGAALYRTANELDCRTIVLSQEHNRALRDIFRSRGRDRTESSVLTVWLVG